MESKVVLLHFFYIRHPHPGEDNYRKCRTILLLRAITKYRRPELATYSGSLWSTLSVASLFTLHSWQIKTYCYIAFFKLQRRKYQLSHLRLLEIEGSSYTSVYPLISCIELGNRHIQLQNNKHYCNTRWKCVQFGIFWPSTLEASRSAHNTNLFVWAKK